MRYVPARAYDNSIFVAFCNQCGAGPSAHAGHRKTPRGGASFADGGVSFICGPTGEVIAGAGSSSTHPDYSEESLLVRVLKASELDRVRESPTGFFRRWHHPKTREWADAIPGSKL